MSMNNEGKGKACPSLHLSHGQHLFSPSMTMTPDPLLRHGVEGFPFHSATAFSLHLILPL